ncbi:hypothetical protein SAMD00079811_49650 [Scytonema sp. HK-05]|nr:hypothetical protein SAMD00079811_49650 [Scytonema sp. HK-05]
MDATKVKLSFALLSPALLEFLALQSAAFALIIALPIAFYLVAIYALRVATPLELISALLLSLADILDD